MGTRGVVLVDAPRPVVRRRRRAIMPAPALGSILVASADPDRLRSWYENAFETTPDPDAFLHFGEVAVLVDGRDDVAARNPEPARVILNFHVDDARATAAHLDSLGVTWLVEPEFWGDAWFGTLLDPDGNCIGNLIAKRDQFRRRVEPRREVTAGDR